MSQEQNFPGYVPRLRFDPRRVLLTPKSYSVRRQLDVRSHWFHIAISVLIRTREWAQRVVEKDHLISKEL